MDVAVPALLNLNLSSSITVTLYDVAESNPLISFAVVEYSTTSPFLKLWFLA